MRGALVLLVLAAAVPARAADGTLTTGASHEVVWTPPTLLPVRGPRFAPVTLDVFVALGHPPSYTAAEQARRLTERGTDLREVVHLFVFGGTSELALEALLEAADQGRFWPLFDRIVQARMTSFSVDELARLGAEAGLDPDRLADALATRRHCALGERLQRASRQTGHHPPELLINGRRMSPWSGDATLARGVAEARARAAELEAAGVPLSQLYDRVLELDEEVPFVIDPLARDTRRRLTIDLTGAPLRGPVAAPVTVVVWGNFACMQCAEVAAALQRVVQAHPGLVRVAWKHFPSYYSAALTLSSSPAETAAEYAAAAQALGGFWPLYDAAMASHLVPARITRLELERLAQAAGLDLGRLHAELASSRPRAAVEHDVDEARRLGVPTAGSVAVDGIPIAGAPSYELLERLVAAELDAGVLERLRRSTR